MDILKSSWRVDKVYFKARLIDGIKEKYVDWYRDDNFYTEEDPVPQEDIVEITSVIDKWLNSGVVELYQWPECQTDPRNKDYETEADYFEKEDDNFVLQRWMFEVVDDRIDVLNEISEINQESGLYE